MVFVIAGVILVSQPAHAGYISLSKTIHPTIENTTLVVTLTTTNNGNEPAYEHTDEILLVLPSLSGNGLEFEKRKTHAVVLYPSHSNTQVITFSLPLPTNGVLGTAFFSSSLAMDFPSNASSFENLTSLNYPDLGNYTVALLVHTLYTDANAYPYSVVTVVPVSLPGALLFSNTTVSSPSNTLDPSFLYPSLSSLAPASFFATSNQQPLHTSLALVFSDTVFTATGKHELTLTNTGPEPQLYAYAIFAPYQLQYQNPVGCVRLLPWQSKTVSLFFTTPKRAGILNGNTNAVIAVAYKAVPTPEIDLASSAASPPSSFSSTLFESNVVQNQDVKINFFYGSVGNVGAQSYQHPFFLTPSFFDTFLPSSLPCTPNYAGGFVSATALVTKKQETFFSFLSSLPAVLLSSAMQVFSLPKKFFPSWSSLLFQEGSTLLPLLILLVLFLLLGLFFVFIFRRILRRKTHITQHSASNSSHLAPAFLLRFFAQSKEKVATLRTAVFRFFYGKPLPWYLTLGGMLLLYSFLLWYFLPWILTPTITTGGDTASHYATLTQLASQWQSFLPNGAFWTMGNYAGFPLLQFYFPLPFFLMLLLSTLVGLPIAFKLGTVLGIFLLPYAVF
ncbi:MAG: hypothetical protein QW594_03830, partial [Candidatus Woesearchaeota archaeon]